jgi:D-serine deaminase-like pyridoxal phosphate-dependent protein
MTEQHTPYSSLDTPAVLVDMNKLEANISRMSRLAAEAGLRLRPHVKVHECAEIAKMQLAAGACGVDVGSMGQAEAMAEAGIPDILISHPGYYGGHKQEKLRKLLGREGLALTLNIDMVEQAEGASNAGEATGKKIPVLIKVDTNKQLGGMPRLGVLPGKPTLELAKQLVKLPGIRLVGLYAHEIGGSSAVDDIAFGTARLISETAALLRDNGIAVDHISVGASNTMPATCRYVKEGKFPDITEVHPGNCVIGDIGYMLRGANTRESCAITVLATVISTSHPEKAAIDAGYKTFGADYNSSAVNNPDYYWNGIPYFGCVQGRPDLRAGRMSAETGYIYYMEADKKLCFGERIEIVPNNATLVVNIHEQLYGVRNGAVEKVFTVTGRGCGN